MRDLQPNQHLLNHKFNGYKLASTKLEDIILPLTTPVHEAAQDGNQYSYLYTRCRGMHNHLYHDQWNGTVYFIDSNLGISTVLYQDSSTPLLYTVSTIPGKERKFPVLSSTLLFPCETLALFCDGGGALYFVRTGQRKKDAKQEWEHAGQAVYDFDRPTHLLSVNMDKDILHLLALTLVEKDGGGMASVFFWLQIKINFEQTSGSVVKGAKRFMGSDLPNAIWLSKDYAQLLIAASKRFNLVDEDLQKIKPPELESVAKPKTYEWTQTKEFVTVTFNLCLTENEVECKLKHNFVSVKLKNGKTLLEGNTERDILFDASRWYVERNRLEVVFMKKTEGEFWTSIIPADTDGSHVIEGEEAAHIQEIGESLSHLTSENGTENTSDERQSFNMAQLEDCDQYSEEDVKLFSIDVFTGEVITQKNFAGHQWLFTCASLQGAAPLICLRHDVDGIVWQPEDYSHWNHVSTFDAFGFVHASKQNSKFTVCSTDFRYAVITDCTSHLYMYASSGSDVTQHNQYVHFFMGCTKILGCQATPTLLYVLTDKDLNIITLP